MRLRFARGSYRLLALLLPLLRPRGKDLVHSPRQQSVLLLRRAEQLRLQLRLNKCSNKLGSLHAATVGHGLVWRQRTANFGQELIRLHRVPL
jgi:hypothetical protein